MNKFDHVWLWLKRVLFCAAGTFLLQVFRLIFLSDDQPLYWWLWGVEWGVIVFQLFCLYKLVWGYKP